MNYPGSLHNHTDYSNAALGFRDSINTIKSLIDYAIELNHEVIAITDHEFVGNAVKVEQYANKVKDKIKVIRGNEIYLCRNGLNNENFTDKDKYYHFILLARDRIGYEQLMELSTRAWKRSYISKRLRRKPTYYSDLEEIIGGNPGHVIGSTACIGSAIGTQLLEYKRTNDPDLYQQIINWCKYLENIFGKGSFFLELQPSASKEQHYVNKELFKLSLSLDIPYIITCDAHYLKKIDADIHAAYLNSQSDAEREVKEFYSGTYLMSTEEVEGYMKEYFTKKEFEVAYNNILKIKDMCEDFSIMKPLRIPELTWKIPSLKLEDITPDWYMRIPYLKKFAESSFEGDRVLIRAIMDRVFRDSTLQNEETYNEINIELESTWISSEVNKAHWSSYYLNLQKIIDTCWEAGSIVGPGRGSGVGFLLLYILDITQINPLRETTKTYHWRFLNPERVSVLDVDFDISGLKRKQVLDKFREVYGEDRVANVATFGTEKSKSAIITAARGLGIDNDVAQYIASLIPSDRGATRTLSQCFYGDVENDFTPVQLFVDEMTNHYPQLWDVAQKIEGLICRMGIHAGGVIFVDEPFTKSTGLMKAPDGTIITQFELHDAEAVSLIKYDALSVEAMDKIQICLELLCRDGLIPRKETLRETYENAIGIYNLERNAKDMWQMVIDHKIQSLFQMEQQSGIQGIALTHPESVDDLATLNSVIRLMAQEKGGEQPLHKFARFKNNINEWYQEMERYGLDHDEQEILKKVIGQSYGICESQERFMTLVQIPECGGFDLNFADRLRKAIAKKNPAAYLELQKEYFEGVEERKLSKPLCNYVWNVLVATSRGYGFNLSHTLAYSLIALQEMNLAYKFPILYWNCANLIVNSGGEEDIEGKTTDYGKIASAVSKMIQSGIKVSLVDINKSSFGFEPDLKNNQILFGMKGLSRVNGDTIDAIIAGRPYKSFKDFLKRCPLNKTIMISLIKAGAFDNLEIDAARKLGIEPRMLIMTYYISIASEPKKKLNLQNVNGLIQKGILPDSLDFEKRVFNFNKYLKAYQKSGEYFIFNQTCEEFYNKYFNPDVLEVVNGVTGIKQKEWDKIYKREMETIKEWLASNQTSALERYNYILFKECWDKYATGNISSWEMESLCFYYHDHELAQVDTTKYGVSDFFNLPKTPEVDYYFKRGGAQIPIFKTSKIIGTVLSKNDTRHSIDLLTTTGVVNVKFTKDHYAMYNRQLSEVGEDGTKHVVESGWFKRGVKLMLTGFRRDDQFVVKTYSHTPTHSIYKITEVNGSEIEIEHERTEV